MFIKRINKAKLIILFLLILLILTSKTINAEKVGILGIDGDFNQRYINTAVNQLEISLNNLKRFTVINQNDLHEYLRQKDHQNILIDYNNAMMAADELDIDLIFWGEMIHLSSSYNSSQREHISECTIKINVWDQEKRSIIISSNLEAESSDSNRNQAYQNAIKAAIEKIEPLVREEFAIYSFIYEVTDDNVTFAGGRNVGVENEWRYKVLEIDQREVGDYRRIGLVEVNKIDSSETEAVIIWESERINTDHVVKELPEREISLTNITTEVFSYQIESDNNSNTDNKIGFSLSGQFGSELPYKTSRGALFGFSILDNNTLLDIGASISGEIQLFPGTLNMFFSGGGGTSFLYDDFPLGNNPEETGVFVKSNLGLKYYLDYETGNRVQFGLMGRFGPKFSNKNLTGLGASLSIGIPVNFPNPLRYLTD